MPSETDVAADLVICADLQLGNCCCRLLLLLALAVLAQSPAAAARDALFSFALKQSWTKRPLLQLQVNMLQICKLYTLFHIQHWEPCPALPCPALPCPALPCPALPCSALLSHATSSIQICSAAQAACCFASTFMPEMHKRVTTQRPLVQQQLVTT